MRGAIFLHKHQPAMTASLSVLGFAAAYAGAVWFCDMVATPRFQPPHPPHLLRTTSASKARLKWLLLNANLLEQRIQESGQKTEVKQNEQGMGDVQ